MKANANDGSIIAVNSLMSTTLGFVHAVKKTNVQEKLWLYGATLRL